MKKILIKNFRSKHNVLVNAMTVQELKENVRKDGTIQAKVLYGLENIMTDGLETVNGDVSVSITGNPCGLTDISYTLAGRTTASELILKVTGTVEFENL